MFRRPLPAGNQSALGNKDKKKLRELLLRSFPLLTEDELELLLPAKEPAVVARMNLPQASQSAGGPQQPSALPPLMSASSANKCSLYFVDDTPVVAEVNGLLFPTVHGLWRAPKMLPCLLILSPVSCFVLKGADLMLPGVCRPLTAAAAAAAGVGSVVPGQLWAIRVAGNALPFAVGRAVTRAPSVNLLGDKGRALELIHHFGDALWKHTKDMQLPPLFSLKQVFSGTDDAELLASCGMGPPETLPGALQQEQQQEGPPEDTEGGGKSQSSDEAPGGEAEAAAESEGQGGPPPPPVLGEEATQAEGPVEPAMTPEEMDVYLDLCLLETLHCLSDDQLPLDISALYSKLTAEGPGVFFSRLSRGDSPFIAPDIRRSSAKKLGKFVQAASKKKLFQTKEQRGVVSVVKVNRSHPDILKYKPLPENQKKKAAEKVALIAGTGASSSGVAGAEDGGHRDASASTDNSGPLVFEFCVPPAKCCKIFAAAGTRTGRNIYFTPQEYRDVLVKYLETRNATKREDDNQHEDSPPPTASPLRSSSVALDSLLAEAILTKDERGESKAAGIDSRVMEKTEVFLRWQATQQPCHAVLRHTDELPLLQDRIVKGACLPIRISVEDLCGGRKHATHILNSRNFLLEPKTVAEFLQKKLAASASVYAPPGSKVTSAICVQGNVGGAVGELLVSHFRIPKKYVEVETKKTKTAGR